MNKYENICFVMPVQVPTYIKIGAFSAILSAYILIHLLKLILCPYK